MSETSSTEQLFQWSHISEQEKRVLFFAKKGASRPPDLYSALKKALRDQLSRPHDPVHCACFLDDRWDNRISVLDAFLQTNAVNLIVCDVTELDSDTMGVLTLALARQIPVLALVHERISQASKLKGLRTLAFQPGKLGKEFQAAAAVTVSDAFKSPDGFVPQNTYRDSMRQRVFIAYSHKNQDVLDRVLVHLKPIERVGLVDAWSDKKIATGALWRDEIETALSRSKAAIFLISADFLASDFITCYELPHLLHKHQAKSLRLFPLIVSPCRFGRDPILSSLQALNDPAMPLLLLSFPQQEEVLDRLAAAIEESLAQR
jgi:hypothetical protein